MAEAIHSSSHSLAEKFLQSHPAVAVSLVEDQPLDNIAQYLTEIPLTLASKLLERMRPAISAQVIQLLGDDLSSTILEGVDLAVCARILAQLDEDDQEKLLGLLKSKVAKAIRELLSYPFDSAGYLMDPKVLSFRTDSSTGQIIEQIRISRSRKLYDLFVVNAEGQLSGIVALQEIVLRQDEERLGNLVESLPVSIHVMATREEVVEKFENEKLTSLPVVNHDQQLIGVIYHDAIVRAAEREATADIQSMVGASKEERALSKVSFAVRKRLPWLQINLGTAFLSAAVVGLFEETIAQFTALAVLLPVVAGQSGNTGAQSLAVTMRGLALREIRATHWPRITFKETSVATINGIAVAIVTSIAVYFWSQSIGLCIVIGVAMIISMAIAGVAGAVIPIILSALGQDPAQSSSIVLTTVTDIAGFFSFLMLATVFSSML